MTSLHQTEVAIACGLGDGDAVCAVEGGDGIAGCGPASQNRQIIVLLQGAAAGVGPGDDNTVARLCDSQTGQTRRLHHRDQTPETASHMVAAAGQGTTGILDPRLILKFLKKNEWERTFPLAS